MPIRGFPGGRINVTIDGMSFSYRAIKPAEAAKMNKAINFGFAKEWAKAHMPDCNLFKHVGCTKCGRLVLVYIFDKTKDAGKPLCEKCRDK